MLGVLGKIPVVGETAENIVGGLAGQSNFRARAGKIDTAKGNAAIRQNATAVAQQNAATARSLAGSASASSAPLALREAQRRAAIGNQQAMQAATAGTLQNEQNAANATLAAQMQAQQINAQTAAANSQGLGRLVGLGLGAGALMMSDARAKTEVHQKGLLQGRHQGQLEAMDYISRLNASMTPERYEPNPNVWAPPAPPPTGMAAPMGASAHPDVIGSDRRLKHDVSFAEQGYGRVLSDARAKKLGEENSALRGLLAGLTRAASPPSAPMEHLPVPPPQQPRNEADAAQYGADWHERNRRDAIRAWAESHQQDRARQAAEANLAEQERRTAHLYEQVSDEDAKMGMMRGEIAPTEAFTGGTGRRAPMSKEERRFRDFYGPVAEKWGLDPNPDNPEHHYDYRAAFRAGARPDATGHWPSAYKDAQHPRRFLPIGPGGQMMDTATMRPVKSDEDSKMGMMHGGMDFPDGVRPTAYRYKPGMGPPGQQYGVIAQDLEKSKEGASTVVEEPESGMKMVDTPKLTMVNTAALAEMNARLDALEARGKKRKRSA